MIWKWLSKVSGEILGWIVWAIGYVRWRFRSRKLHYRIRARAGDRYDAAQPLLTDPKDYETFVRLGNVDVEVQAGARTWLGAEAAEIVRRLYDRGLLFGSGPDVEYHLPSGTVCTDPADVEPGTKIGEIRMENTVRVDPDFLDFEHPPSQ